MEHIRIILECTCTGCFNAWSTTSRRRPLSQTRRKGKVRVKKDADYIFHELTRSICSECKKPGLESQHAWTPPLKSSRYWRVEGKLKAFLAFQRVRGVPTADGRLKLSPELLTKVVKMMTSGELGYWLFVEKSTVNQPSEAAVAPISYLHPVGWYMIVIRNNSNQGEPLELPLMTSSTSAPTLPVGRSIRP